MSTRTPALRWDIQAARWERARKGWYPDNVPRSRAWTQLVSKVGAVRYAGARVWLPVWQRDEDRLATVDVLEPQQSKQDATRYALEAIAYYYGDKFAGDFDLRVVHFKPSELEGFQYIRPEGFDPVDAPAGLRRVKYFLP